MAEQYLDPVIPNNDFIRHGIHQGPGRRQIHVGDESQPMRRQARSRRHRNDRSLQPHEAADGHHHRAVGQWLRAANLEGLADGGQMAQHTGEVAEASARAMGCVRVSTTGVTMTGSRWTSWRNISRLIPPSPITMPALSAVVGAESIRIASTSRRAQVRGQVVTVIAQSAQIDDLRQPRVRRRSEKEAAPARSLSAKSGPAQRAPGSRRHRGQSGRP